MTDSEEGKTNKSMATHEHSDKHNLRSETTRAEYAPSPRKSSTDNYPNIKLPVYSETDVAFAGSSELLDGHILDSPKPMDNDEEGLSPRTGSSLHSLRHGHSQRPTALTRKAVAEGVDADQTSARGLKRRGSELHSDSKGRARSENSEAEASDTPGRRLESGEPQTGSGRDDTEGLRASSAGAV